jgi:hypothetical protein
MIKKRKESTRKNISNGPVAKKEITRKRNTKANDPRIQDIPPVATRIMISSSGTVQKISPQVLSVSVNQ